MAEMTMEEILSRVVIQVCSTADVNANIDKEKYPVVQDGELLFRPVMCIGEKSIDGSFNEAVYVTKEMANNWGYDEESIFSLAKENGRNLFPGEVVKMADIFNKNEGIPLPNEPLIPQVYVVTNKNNICGAATVFYQPDLMANIADLSGKDLAIFLAGQNVVLMVPVSDESKLNEYREMFREAVESMPEGLSKPIINDILRYDMASKSLIQEDGNVIGKEIEMAGETYNMSKGR